MSVTVRHRAYRFRCYPTPAHADNLRRTFGCARLVYNKALEYRHKAYYRRGETVTYNQTSAMLTRWKQTDAYEFLNEVSSVPLQQALRHLQKGFATFFKQQTGYPHFKKKRTGAGSAEYTRSAFTFVNGQRTLAKQTEPLTIRWSRELPYGAVPSTVTVSCDAAGRWFVSLLVEEDIPTLPEQEAAVGVDAGITSLLTLSTGEQITYPRHERRDLLHKLTTRLVNENQVIAVEDLHVRGMLANGRLSRAIADAAWAEFGRMLEYKAEWAGRTVVAVDRFLPTTKTCSACGTMKTTMPLSQRVFECAACGHTEDRDLNAAKNILAAGLAVTACRDGVRH